MYLRIQVTASKSTKTPLFGRSIYVSIRLVRGQRVKGKPRQLGSGLGAIASFTVEGGQATGEVNWNEIRARFEKFKVPASKQEQFISQIEGLLAAIAAAKSDPELRLRLQSNPNRVLSELRRQTLRS
jgi:hypothetical protein